MNSFIVEFLTFNGYAESTFSTSEMNSKEWDVDKFAWNNTIDWDSDINYNFSGNSFSIYNGGNIAIDAAINNLIINIIGTANSFYKSKMLLLAIFTDIIVLCLPQIL